MPHRLFLNLREIRGFEFPPSFFLGKQYSVFSPAFGLK